MSDSEEVASFSSLRARFEQLAGPSSKPTGPSPSPSPKPAALAAPRRAPAPSRPDDSPGGGSDDGRASSSTTEPAEVATKPPPTSRGPPPLRPQVARKRSLSGPPPVREPSPEEEPPAVEEGKRNTTRFGPTPALRLQRERSRSQDGSSSPFASGLDPPRLSPVLASPSTANGMEEAQSTPAPAAPPLVPFATRPTLPSAASSTRKTPPPVPPSRKTTRPVSPVPPLPATTPFDDPPDPFPAEPSSSVKALASRFAAAPPPASRSVTAPNTPPDSPFITISRDGSVNSTSSAPAAGPEESSPFEELAAPRSASPVPIGGAAPPMEKPRPVIPPRPALNTQQPEGPTGRSVPPPPPLPSRSATSPAVTSVSLPTLPAPTVLERTPSNPGLSTSPEKAFLPPPPPRKLPPPLVKTASLSRAPSSVKAIPPRPIPTAVAPVSAPVPVDAPYVPPPPPSRAVAATERLAPKRPGIATPGGSGDESSSDEEEDANVFNTSQEFPDATFANRRPPLLRNRKPIHSQSHIHSFAVRGTRVVTGHHAVHVWHPSHYSGASESISPPGGDHKITALEFRAAGADEPANDGRYVWAGTKEGHLFEIDTSELCIVSTRLNIHLSPVVGIYRVGRSMITLEESGKVLVWGAFDSPDAPQLAGTFKAQRVPDKQNFYATVGNQLWTSSGPVTKPGSSAVSMRSPQIRVYDPTTTGNFSVLPRPMTTPESVGHVGAVTASAIVPSQDHLVYLGHENGFVSVWDRQTYACLLVQRVSPYMITSLVGIGKNLWAGFRTGLIYVYDVRSEPWTVTKAWKAHKETVLKIVVDPASLWADETLQVASMGSDMAVHLWDGLLRDDWLDAELNLRQPDFCTFRSIRTLCISWNIDASKPQDLSGTPQNLDFLRDVLLSTESPDIISFGFQEMIDLEDKKLTAKSMLLGKKKGDAKFSDGISSSYRLWHDKLVQAVRLIMPPECPYTVVHVGDMIGLFSCIFVKSSESASLRDVAKITVKTGMGGRHGNKGGILARFVIDDTSLCFINCHLAAGQAHRRQRDHDLVDILEDKSAFSGLGSSSPGAYAPGGDGTTVFDHELCILSGDLNYRIDARRDNVIAAAMSGAFETLLPHDQLLKGLATNQTFRLRSFKEPTITFAPTYKYDPGTDSYDSSAKKRIPAWCDRILYRADREDKITALPQQYRRWEVNVSDHRPISSAFDMQVKSIIAAKRALVWEEIEAAWFGVESAMLTEARDYYGGG